jgi:hypothetical protein
VFGAALGVRMPQETPLDPHIQKIVDEEVLRARIARSMATPPKKSWLNENLKWLMVTIAIPLSTYLFGQWQEHVARIDADSREAIATQDRNLERVLGDARNNVSAMTALLPALSDSDPDRSNLALIVLKQLEKAQHSNDTRLGDLLIAVQTRIDQLANSSSQATRERAARQQEALSQAIGTARTVAPDTQPAAAPQPAAVQQVTETKPRIVYIQFFDETQRAKAAAAQKLLRADGVGAPGIEKIGINSAARSGRRPPRIFYFNDADLGGAKWLQKRLSEADLGNWPISHSSMKGIPAGQIELWWPQGPESGG